MAAVFTDAEAVVVEFDNPLQERLASNTVYVGSVGTAIAQR